MSEESSQPECVAVANRLRERASEIASLWATAVPREAPAVASYDRPILLNHVPELLESFVRALESGSMDTVELREDARVHGEQRTYLEGYDQELLIREYRLLREILTRVLFRDATPDIDAMTLLNLALDTAIEESVKQFQDSTSRQFEHLRQVTESTLTHLRLDDILDELLERTRNALGTDTAVILLVAGDRLQVRAAKGLEEEVQQQVSIPIGEGFAGRIAATGEPLMVPDVGRYPVWSPYIRERGIRSLLGVPLLVERRTIGVMHVGTMQQREFTAWESRFLRLVADRSALTIDRARLLDELEEAGEQKSRFMATVAHELRTPLSAITNALYILENMSIPDERASRQLMMAGRQTRQLARLAEDLLDITRINRGKLDLKLDSVSLCRVARDAAETVRPLIDARGQDLDLKLSSEKLLVEGDPVRLEQVITNLLGNAAKYTEPGGDICLEVTREGSEALVRIADTGIGIDPLVLPQIFDMFHQVEGSQARSQGGLGIGLALVKRLVEMHGGSIQAKSAGTGSGAEFEVRFPLLGTLQSERTSDRNES